MDVSLSELQELVMDREAWRAACGAGHVVRCSLSAAHRPPVSWLLVGMLRPQDWAEGSCGGPVTWASVGSMRQCVGVRRPCCGGPAPQGP